MLLAASPWPFASNDPRFEAVLAAGVLVLASLWCLHATRVGRLSFRFDWVTACLGGLTGWTAFQLVPLPEDLVGLLSPTRLEWHRAYLPEQIEMLPGETAGESRPRWLPLTIDPSATRTLLARLVQLMLVYVIARNWLASRSGLRRLAWVMAATGTALAFFAVLQLSTSGSGFVYWSIPVQGAVFGPFVCRNHYPDFVAVCLGLAVGLLIPRRGEGRPADRDQAGLLTPRGWGLAIAVGLMAVTIALSLSRGAILAAVGVAGGLGLLAIWFRPRGSFRAGGLVALGGAATVAVVIVGWLGADGIQARLDTLTAVESADSRSGLWQDAARLARPFWLTGTGGGSFVWVEPLVRSGRSPAEVVDHAHNEYLEAVVEGGLPRLLLTLGLAAAVLVPIARGYARRHDRSVGPVLLGLAFGLGVVAVHAAGDFALHMPAVALLAAAAAGYAVAAATDPDFVSATIRRPRSAPDVIPLPAPAPAPERRSKSLTGGKAAAVVIVGVGSALLAAVDARARERCYRLKLAADWVYADANRTDRLAERARLLAAAAAIRPDDPEVLFAAAQGEIDYAVELALATPDRPTPEPADDVPANLFPKAVIDGRLVPALRLLRAARAADPVAPKPHTRLALYAELFARSEPAGVHFGRAQKLVPADPDLWFVSGKFAYRRGDWPTAWHDWRQSLTLAPRHREAILAAAEDVLLPWQTLTAVLPPDAALVWAAANQLFPDRDADPAARRLYLLAAVAAADRPEAGTDQFAAAAQASAELGNPAAAFRAWRRALELAPDLPAVRDGYALWLESEERYEEAIPHLEWLLVRGAGGAVPGRYEAAVRGRLLARQLKRAAGER